jgi:hypothetical protein
LVSFARGKDLWIQSISLTDVDKSRTIIYGKIDEKGLDLHFNTVELKIYIFLVSAQSVMPQLWIPYFLVAYFNNLSVFWL